MNGNGVMDLPRVLGVEARFGARKDIGTTAEQLIATFPGKVREGLTQLYEVSGESREFKRLTYTLGVVKRNYGSETCENFYRALGKVTPERREEMLSGSYIIQNFGL